MILPSNVGSLDFAFLFIFLASSSFFILIVKAINFNMSLFTTSKADIFVRIKIVLDQSTQRSEVEPQHLS